MKRGWITFTLLVASWLLPGIENALAQGLGPIFEVASPSPPATVRFEGLKERVGTITLTAVGGGTVSAKSEIHITYSAPIADESGVVLANVVCQPCSGSIGVIAKSPDVIVHFNNDVVFKQGNSVSFEGLRLDANATSSGAELTGAASATSPAGGNPITFSGNPAIVATVGPAPSTTVTIPVQGSLLSCSPNYANASFTINVAENFPNAFSSQADESLPPNSPPATTGTQLVVAVLDVPAGVTLTPVTPVQTPPPVQAPLVFGPTPPPQTSSSNGATLTFTYVITADDPSTVEGAILPFSVSGPTSLPSDLPSVTANVSLGPTDPANTPQFAPANLEGTGTVIAMTSSSPIATLSPPSLSFGPQMVGTTSAPQSATLSNTGKICPLTITSISIAGDFGSPSNTCGGSVADGASCMINVTFTPTATGARSGTLSVVDNGSNSPQSVPLSGTGVQATTTTMVSSSVNPSVFDQSVTFTATVTPKGTGTPTGTITFNDGTTAVCSAVPLSSAQAMCATSSLAPGTHSITAVYSGDTNFLTSTSLPLTQTVNPATTTTTITFIAPNPATFGQTVAVSYTVTVNPPASGTVPGTDTVTVADTTGASCTGTVAAGNCSLVPKAAGPDMLTAKYAGDIGFNGSTSAAVPETVNKALPTFSNLTPSQSIPFGTASIILSGTLCASVLCPPPGETVTITINGSSANAAVGSNGSFSASFDTHVIPAATAPYPVTYLYAGDNNFISNKDATTTLTVSAAPVVQITTPSGTPSLSFTNQTPQMISVHNLGNAPLKISGVSIIPSGSGFLETDNCQVAPIAPGSSCTISVNFAPSTPGSKTATVSITDNAAGSPQAIALSGTLTDFSLAPPPPSPTNPTPTMQTVPPGGGATYLLILTPTAQFTGTITLTCMVTAPQSTCAVRPTTVTLSSSTGPVQVFVTVTTTAGSKTAPRQRPRVPPPPTLIVLGLCLAALAIATSWAGQRRRAWLPLGATMLFVALWAGCAGSSGPPGTSLELPAGGTPPGTYTISVTATSEKGVIHLLNLTLVVTSH